MPCCFGGRICFDHSIIRLDKPSYPFCIEELGANGSRSIIERWATEALAADRLWDIKDEEIAGAIGYEGPTQRLLSRAGLALQL